jgi:hypothetical protein
LKDVEAIEKHVPKEVSYIGSKKYKPVHEITIIDNNCRRLIFCARRFLMPEIPRHDKSTLNCLRAQSASNLTAPQLIFWQWCTIIDTAGPLFQPLFYQVNLPFHKYMEITDMYSHELVEKCYFIL